MVATTCPAPEELRNYALGRLSEAQWEAIDGHVESCAECQAALATVDDVADTLLTRLRGPAPEDDFLKESQCEAALARARHLASHAHASGGEAPGSPPFRELGEYQVLEELGQGGMGAVYKALHKKLDRVVAVKILARGRSGDERAIARFEREMKAVGRFDHPHIVRAYDAREIGGSPVLVMEFVEGMDLGRLVQRLGPLPIADACELVRQSAAGLQYVHEQGLVHRDLKPSNLMLTPQGTVKILDLGLALFHFDQPSGEVTHTGQAMGTVDYMAPEQASDSHAVDIRADIYSLGCTLYKLLTGRAPFEGGDYKGTFEKMTAHVHQPVPPIADLLPQIPKELAAVIQRMLAKEPANRFAQPADVVEALTPFCWDADLPELIARAAAKETSFSQPLPAFSPAPPPSSLPRPATLSLRLRTFVAIAVGLLMLGGGIGFALGILITIKKDGKTTALEVPAGQKVQIDEQGNATVDVDGSTNKG
jgi:serine/threonine protein kinase